jgi:hypothetical protein
VTRPVHDAHRLREDARPTHTPPSRLELALLATIVIFGLAVRLYRLGSFPDTLLGDEADNAQAAIRILHGHLPPHGFFGLDWTQQPAFSVYLLSGFIHAFGFSIFTIRLPSAILGALALVPFHLLLRRQFSTAASLLGTLLFATNVWYLNFSRSGWNCGHVCLYMLMAMLFLMQGLDRIRDGRKAWVQFGLVGLFCAFGLYGYPSGRAIALGIVAFLPFAVYFNWTSRKTLVVNYILTGAVIAALFAPQAVTILGNWRWFNHRTGTVALVNSPAYKSDPMRTIRLQIERNLRAPWDGRVNNTAQYSPVAEPQLDRAAGALTLAGLILSVTLSRLRRRPETWLWWVLLLSAWVPTQLFTVATPNGARGVIYVPAFLYFSAISLDAALRFADRVQQRLVGRTSIDWLPVAVAAALVVVASLANVHHYWSWQSRPRTRRERWIYVTASEFPAWAAWVNAAADSDKRDTNLGQWRELHPIPDPSAPPGRLGSRP